MGASPEDLARTIADRLRQVDGLRGVDANGRLSTPGPRGGVKGIGVYLRHDAEERAWIGVELVALGDRPLPSVLRTSRDEIRDVAAACGVRAERIDAEVTDIRPTEPTPAPERSAPQEERPVPSVDDSAPDAPPDLAAEAATGLPAATFATAGAARVTVRVSVEAEDAPPS